MADVQEMFMHPGPQPNGLQAADDGLWVIDQTDNHIYKLDWENGSVIENLPADVGHSSGITLGGGYIWVSSTYPVEAAGDDGSPKLVKCNPDGSTASRYDTPGSKLNVLAGKITGAHGMAWVDDENMWVAVPPSQTVYLMDPGTMTVKRSIPCPGDRPHGLFINDGCMLLADTTLCKIHKLDMEDGKVLGEIDVPAPEVHGMTVHNDRIWFCCAVSRRVCSVSITD